MKRENNERTERLTLVTGVVLSVALGVFFYFRTDLSTALATFAGLIGITITLQIESLFRERRDREEATRQQRLIERIESVAWMPELLDHALSAMGVIEQTYRSTMAVDLARKAFDDCLAQLKDLQRGHYSTPDTEDSPNSPFYALTEQLRHSLLTTAIGEDLEWWLHPSVSRTYWHLNVQALRRGVTIRRIFIYEDWTDELAKVATLHHESGVQVFRVAREQLPATLRINLIIWDGTCSLEFRNNSAGEMIGQIFTFAAQDLALMEDRFKLIESCAERWPAKAAP